MNVNNIKGRPNFSSGQFLGYVLWKQTDGFHLRWTTKGDKKKTFQGKISYQNKLKITKIARPETEVKIHKTATNLIQWSATEKGRINGFDFVALGNFAVELRINNKKIKPKRIFLGQLIGRPPNNPIIIIQFISADEKVVEKDFKRKLKEKSKELLKEVEPEPLYESILKTQLKFQPVKEPEPVYEPEPEPEPVYEPEPEPVYEPEPEPVYEPEPEPVYEPEPEPVYEPEPEPVYEPEPEPVYEPEPEPVYEPEPEPEPIYKPDPEPIHEPEPEPIYEGLPEVKPESLEKETFELDVEPEKNDVENPDEEKKETEFSDENY